MKSCEDFVSSQSDYYVHFPSITAQTMFFYPLYTGYFIYKSGYSLYRSSYDSFLLMYVKNGSLLLEYENQKEQANDGCFVFLDCYQSHAYSSMTGWESLWCHFDGPAARAYYTSICSRLGTIFSLTDPYPVLNKMNAIFQMFHSDTVIKEPLLSKYLTDILTYLLMYSPSKETSIDYAGLVEDIVSYLNEHFTENISVEQLANRAGFSQYHFIRIFKKETGFTPHEYLINIRMNTAKYLLKNTRLTIKDICFNTGFSCESVFCNAFKKYVQLTPAQYRALNNSYNYSP